MAFHVACPITCRKICYCPLGFARGLQGEKGKNEFLEEVGKLEEFLKDPWLLRARENATIQVKVPKVVVAPPPQSLAVGDAGTDAEEAAAMLSAQTKRAVLQKKAAAASLVAEDYARRFESGDLVEPVKDTAGEELTQSNAKIMCRLCFRGENDGSEKAKKMLSCKTCGKKYHRSCLKTWAQNRDLFHWSSWTCPSCRICEACRRSGDPNKFMFCKRCDAAYHCYCMHPPHKNVSSGPYLCPKHTRCHSCNSSVPGNGLSVRWFLGYTCCDACGRLFVKGNYCPVCLKVYRDSESTPMVCCDICQRWVHCQCDGISDEKYLQFQVDGNLQYACPTCRGDCYQVRNLEEAVQELWRRKDEADKGLIASLRAAAGLPTQEEIFSISPFSDDEDSPVVSKNEYGRSLKFSLKGLAEKSPKKSKEYGKKSSSKKYGKNKGHQISSTGKAESHLGFEGHTDAPSGDIITNEEIRACKSGERDCFSPAIAGSLTEGICSVNEAGVVKHKFIDEVTANNGNRASRMVQIKGNKHHSTSDDDVGTHTTSKTTKGTKLVIHLGTWNKNLTGSPKSEASSCPREQNLTTSNGSEDLGQQKLNEYTERKEIVATGGKGHRADQMQGQKVRGKEGHVIKIKKPSPETADGTVKPGNGSSASPLNAPIVAGKRSNEGSVAAPRTVIQIPGSRGNKVSSARHAGGEPGVTDDSRADDRNSTPPTHPVQKDPKPLLKLKFKNPYPDGHNAWASTEDEKGVIKGQRSKRKRPLPSGEKSSATADPRWYEDNSMDEMMDANWILQKLGKDAIGKRVEVHQQSDNTWHRGKVTEFFEGPSVVAVTLDDGKTENIELGKQGIRFVPQKQMR
ncbi:uncharacterized protein LOC116029953 isoform X2 [Ipomoea triloba]|uniref:uncharacterized protein LOC116029953 isoform X2 n=1 Tax=Ipomoea triloba TaxID=35885 RepID=UPI00125D6AA0|nr:uncharacterized protein LOC116029953 isoform X2 [Ipomoea triloba]